MGGQAQNARQGYLEQHGAALGWTPEMVGQIEQHLQGFEDNHARGGVDSYLAGQFPQLGDSDRSQAVEGIFGAIRQGGLGEGGGGFGGGEAGGDPLGN